MTAPRSRKEEKQYMRHHKLHHVSKCPFCEINPDEIVEETANYYVLCALFPYSMWDGQKIDDHLLISPKKHTDKLGGSSAEAAAEFLNIVDKYETDGYNLYARAPGSIIKSVVHQHTHLIKLVGKRKKFIFYIKKPYIRISF